METMFSPWRSEYLDTFKNEANGIQEECFLCAAATNPNEDEKRLVVARLEFNFIVLNRYPYNSGHLLIAPYRHVASLDEISDEEYSEMTNTARIATRIIGQLMRPSGFNIGMNIGRAAGAGVPGHVHLHVVPRWTGDANFMSTIGDIKVVSQSLAATREEFAREFMK